MVIPSGLISSSMTTKEVIGLIHRPNTRPSIIYKRKIRRKVYLCKLNIMQIMKINVSRELGGAKTQSDC